MTNSINSLRNRSCLFSFGLGCLFVFASAMPAAAASITLSATSVSAAPGSSMDSFEVDLTNLGSTALTIGGFSFDLSVASTDIVLTDVTSATEAGYIFSGKSLFGPDLSGPNSSQTITASDVAATPFTGTTISPGQEVGLGHVLFNVTSGATPGVFAVTLASFPATTLSDVSGNNISIDVLSAGQITITGPTTATPEPSSLLITLAFGALLVLTKRIRKQSDQAPSSH
jgi:hypothetical protein